jgi:hypothetical protein
MTALLASLSSKAHWGTIACRIRRRRCRYWFWEVFDFGRSTRCSKLGVTAGGLRAVDSGLVVIAGPRSAVDSELGVIDGRRSAIGGVMIGDVAFVAVGKFATTAIPAAVASAAKQIAVTSRKKTEPISLRNLMGPACTTRANPNDC